MIKLLSVLLAAAAINANAQSHQLELLWETDSVSAVPESVLPDLKKKILYISLIDGGSWVADGKGGVAILQPDGEFNATRVTGLNAPKGLGILGKQLYVADINEVVVVNISTGKIEKRIVPENASGLNDVTVTDKGIVYVSDSKVGRIWRIEKNAATLYLDSVKGVNGLKAVGNELYIGAGKSFVKADRNKTITKVAEIPQGIDGIEPVGNGDFIVTSWGGYNFYV